ncbi:MAG: hypothetical protein U5L02_08870 [Rheinheimera sp.]|nr:hypothetical protein [Rheinheimera sp.]
MADLKRWQPEDESVLVAGLVKPIATQEFMDLNPKACCMRLCGLDALEHSDGANAESGLSL